MINKIPVIGWILSAVAAIGLAVPFWVCWTACGIGATYFYFLPTTYQSIPFWSILKGLIPSIASVSQSNTNGPQK